LINNPAILTGMVLNGAHGIYDVHTDEGVLRCTLRGKLKKAFAQANSGRPTHKTKSSQPQKTFNPSSPSKERIEHRDSSENPLPTRLSVGDYVRIRRLDDHNGLIEEILPRQSELTRKDSASTTRKMIQQTLLANLDQVVLVFAMAQPEPHFGLLDRYLAICESAQLHPIICLNKADLPHSPAVDEDVQLYQNIGYTLVCTSTHTSEGVADLRTLLKDHISLFTGPSGVGKSSLVNAIEPGMAIRTGLISDATGKGKHTTTGSQLYQLSAGGWLADSAGIRALSAWNIAPEELADCFIEFRPFIHECQYDDCSHIDEDGCAVIQAVQDGHVNERRYHSYTRMYQGEER
jgi:ribosome biogenesis GTPase / thiamine phosphate phosphatase